MLDRLKEGMRVMRRECYLTGSEIEAARLQFQYGMEDLRLDYKVRTLQEEFSGASDLLICVSKFPDRPNKQNIRRPYLVARWGFSRATQPYDCFPVIEWEELEISVATRLRYNGGVNGRQLRDGWYPPYPHEEQIFPIEPFSIHELQLPTRLVCLHPRVFGSI